MQLKSEARNYNHYHIVWRSAEMYLPSATDTVKYLPSTLHPYYSIPYTPLPYTLRFSMTKVVYSIIIK